MFYNQAKFLKSAARAKQFPEDLGKEVAFVGRSNAGKSSALNALTQQRNLARTSKTPGRTQLINFFELTPDKRLVDLPGFGYAKVSEKMKKNWHQLIDYYLRHRKSLCGVVLLMDIRHPLKEFEQQMINWANQRQLPLHILLTKADKLKRGPQLNIFQKITHQLSPMNDNISLQLFSAKQQIGRENLKNKLDQWFGE